MDILSRKQKYHLSKLDIRIVEDGTILFRIIYEDWFVEQEHLRSNLGGYIETEKNLSQSGRCMILDNAIVYQRARIKNNARILDNAIIYGCANISDNAIIKDQATVLGCTKVCGDAKIYGNAKIYGKCTISDTASIYENAAIGGYTQIKDSASIYGNVTICENIIIKNYIKIRNAVQLLGLKPKTKQIYA